MVYAAWCNRFWFAGGASLALVLSGCRQDGRIQVQQPTLVRTVAATNTDSAADLVLSGTLEADVSVGVGFRGLGTVQKVLVSEGQTVRQGQVLAIQDDASLKDQLATAQAKAAQADDAYNRMEPMHKNGTLPDIKWVEVETGRDQARSMVSMAQRNRDDAVLRTPLSGIVAKRSVEPGEQAPVGQAAFTVVQIGTMLATVAVAEKDVSRIKVGTSARVSVSATGRNLVGKVREIGVVADPFTRTYKVKVAVPNPGGELRVGMVSEVRLRVPTGRPSVVVPTAAVLVDAENRRFVWIAVDGKARRRVVKIAGFLGEGVAVDSGLSAGEPVVVSGTPMLSEGLPVRVGN
jgi:membrane fusion protein, multidrug efflux system